MFSGSIVALITPMDPVGAVDYDSLKRLVDFHLSNQTDALVIMGTTGESVTLNFAEQLQVLEAVLVQVDGRILAQPLARHVAIGGQGPGVLLG